MASFKDKVVCQTFDKVVLFDHLDDCTIFKFIAFKHLNFPFRHTGFLLFFDNVPKYTINVRPAEDTWAHYLQSLIMTEAKITIESAEELGNVSYVGRPVVHVVGNEEERDVARRDLVTLLTPKKWYSLLLENCRDHVRKITRLLNDDHPGIEDSQRGIMRQIHWEDVSIFAVIAAMVAVPVMILFKK